METPNKLPPGIMVEQEVSSDADKPMCIPSQSPECELPELPLPQAGPSDKSNENSDDNKENSPAENYYIEWKNNAHGEMQQAYMCGYCHRAFWQYCNFTRHLPVHTKEKKYHCNECGRDFAQMSTLSQHRAIHTNKRAYVCEICDKTFNRSSTLSSHRRTHVNVKAHQCHICDKSFHQKGNLRSHIYTHTGARPYKCDVCGKGFNQQSNLNSHKTNFHPSGEQLVNRCATCGKEFKLIGNLHSHEKHAHPKPDAKNAAAPAVGDDQVLPPVPAGDSTVPLIVTYTNSVVVPAINTEAMQKARAGNISPFAIFSPAKGVSNLVRVLPSGSQHMLLAATVADIQKYGQKMEIDVSSQPPLKPSFTMGAPVVATVVQRRRKNIVVYKICEPGDEPVLSDDEADDPEEDGNVAVDNDGNDKEQDVHLDNGEDEDKEMDSTNDLNADNADTVDEATIHVEDPEIELVQDPVSFRLTSDLSPSSGLNTLQNSAMWPSDFELEVHELKEDMQQFDKKVMAAFTELMTPPYYEFEEVVETDDPMNADLSNAE